MHWQKAINSCVLVCAAVVLTACANKDRAAPSSPQEVEAGSTLQANGEAIQASSSVEVPHNSRARSISAEVPGARVEAISLLGEDLYIVDQPSALNDKREAELAAAQAKYDRDPHNEDAIIWLGRRLAYLGRFNDAIAVYTNGLAIYPDSARILRHRGHRYITIRLFNLAQDDLERAAILVQGHLHSFLTLFHIQGQKKYVP
jgi:tetratricopeptide (TPR) repeat protein